MFAPKDSNVMYTCSQHVWKTTNDGQTWEKISPDLTYADPETLGKTGGVITMDMNGPEIYATVFALAPSNHDINTIWAGSDDGKIHITRDGGKNWTDITPTELPKFSRVSIIDESIHNPGTLYVAANRYQVDDREPYVFKTHDYGKTWTKIINGIAPGHFARAIREDHQKEGLLFLATEHGVYFSINDGAQWQSLQLNLPDTPIRDLVIKDNDVVLGSHGRGFWILDDIQPFREYSNELIAKKQALFKPTDAIRGIYDATFQYYLQEEVDTITFEILDNNNALIDSFGGNQPKYEEKKSTSWWGGSASTKPTTAKGLNSFSWNLRYPGPTTFDGIIIWGAAADRGPKAPLGDYTIRMKIGEEVVQTAPFKITMDPNLKGITAEDLQEQFQLASKITQKASIANEAVIQIRNIRKQLDSLGKTVSNKSFQKQSKAFLDTLTEIEEDLYQVKNRSGQDPLNFPIKLNNRFNALQRSIETGDAKPTDGAYQVFDELSKELDVHLAKLNETLKKQLPKINAALQKNGASTIKLP
jgi:photosystem II stability/assembly factor-like uncharacterized protein